MAKNKMTDSAIMLRRDVEHRINKARAIIEPALPKHVDFESMVAKAFLEIHSNPELQKDPPVAPVTVFWAFVHATSLGLSVGRASEEAYILPFRDKNSPFRRATLVLGYKGLTKLAYQHPRVGSINCRYVCENDVFDIDLGSEPKVTFKPNMLADRGSVIGAFAVVDIAPERGSQVGKIIEVMARREIDKVRASARGSDDPSSPWNTWYEEMAVKTVLRRALKRSPRSSEVDRALQLESAFERGETPPGEVETPFEEEPKNGGRAASAKDRVRQKATREPEPEGDGMPMQDGPEVG